MVLQSAILMQKKLIKHIYLQENGNKVDIALYFGNTLTMLIEFVFENHRSFRAEQRLSMVANNHDKSLPGHLIDLESVSGFRGVNLLKGAALYGANASGKSNVLDALQFMDYFVENSAIKLQPGDAIKAQPFLLAPGAANEPSRFEITAIIEGTRYQYGFSVTRERVTHEILVAYPKGHAQKWFERRWDAHKKKYSWSSPTANFRYDQALKDKTRDNALFVSTGAQWNHKQLDTIYQWFKKTMHFLHLGVNAVLTPGHTSSLAKKEPKIFEQAVALLQRADFGLVGATVEEHQIPVEDLKAHLPPAMLKKMEEKGDLREITETEIKLQHQADGMDPVAIDFDSESAGTQRFFALVGPWLEMLEKGQIVCIDELESSLHPNLVAEFLKLLFCAKHNRKGAQVIFTTHNSTLLGSKILRRDQIWFTEKKPTGDTFLYPLTDYKPRNTESLEKGYLTGRYGGVPYIPEGLCPSK
ncbi:MAG: ATP-binding protein [Verrucomicrobiota bacterium]